MEIPSPSLPAEKKRWWHSSWVSFLGVVLLVVVVRSSLVNHYYVPSGSMEPTLMPGDRVVVNMTAYGISPPFSRWDMISGDRPKRGEIVVFPSPESNVRLIKRVVAVGGDRVEVKNGRLFLNGESMAAPVSLREELLDGRRFFLDFRHGGGPDLEAVDIPEGQLLLMGDARGNSRDGRMYGLVSEKNIYGRATGVFYRKGDGFGWFPL